MRNLSLFFRRSLPAILVGALICIAFSACNNFLNAGKVSEDIKEAIAYNNARSVNVTLSCKDEEGSLFPQSSYQAKLGYAFEVQFIPNTDNYIVTENSAILKAVSRINDEESREENVEFTPVSQSYEDQKNGLYRVKVKVTKYADDIKLIPACTSIPKIQDIYPPYNPGGYNQDTVIKITFSKPVDPQSFGNFNCISFSTSEGNISSCYGTPYFSSDNTVLYIPTVPGKRIIKDGTQGTVDVTIKIDCTSITDTEGVPFVQNQPYTYCLKEEVDSIKPVIKTAKATTTGDTTAWYYRELTDKAFGSWSSAEVKEADGTTVKYYYGDYSQNHVGNSIHISLQGYDNADAVAGVCVREVFEKTSSGSEAGPNEETTFYDNFQTVTDENGNTVFTEDGKTLYAFDFDYEFKNKLNGVISLEISLIDGAGKYSDAKNYSVIKISGISRKVSFDLALDPDDSLPQLINGRYKSHIGVPEKIENVYGLTNTVFKFSLGVADKLYGNCLSTCSKFVLMFYDENNNPISVYEKKNFTSNSDITDEINSALQDVLIDTYRDTKGKAVFYEANGIIKELDFTIPAPGEILSVKNGIILTTNTVVKPVDNKILCYVTYKASEEAEATQFWKKTYSSSGSFSLSNITKPEYTTPPYENGIYTFYVKESTVYGETVAEGCTIRRAYTKPFIYIKDGISTQSLSLYPQNVNTVYDNSTRMMTLTLKNIYPTDEYLYYIVVTNGGNVYFSEERAKSIVFPYISTSNSADNCCYIIKKDYNQKVVGVSGVYNFDGSTSIDIRPPVLKYLSGNSPPMAFHYYDSSFLNFDRFGIYNDNGTDNPTDLESLPVQFVCYYLPVNVGEKPVVNVVKTASVYSKELQITGGGDLCSVKIPFSDLEMGAYYLYAYLKDNEGNESCERIASKFKISGKVYQIDNGVNYFIKDAVPSVSNEGTAYIKITLEEENNQTYDHIYKYQLLQDNTTKKWYWNQLGQTNNYFWKSGDTNYYTYEKDCFIKVTASDLVESHPNENNLEFDYAHYKPLYYYSNYVMGEITCNSTAWMKVANGYQIFCDAPVLVHTMYSKLKITETASEEDALEWEARAFETGLGVYNTESDNTNFTYKEDKKTNLAEVPDGNWYTIICHFADGTVLMSPVEQMHK